MKQKYFSIIFTFILFLTACAPQAISSNDSAYTQSTFVITDRDKIEFYMAISGLGFMNQSDVKLQTLSSAGTYSVTVKNFATKAIVENNMPLELMKGSHFPPSPDAQYLIMATRDGKTWFKVSPRSGLDQRLVSGFEALNYETLHAGVMPPEMKILSIAGQDYVAYQMPYYGKTVTAMVAENGFNATAKFVYESAFRNAVHLVVEHGIIMRDPNPGNIIQLTDANGNIIGGMLIDFETGQSIHQTPTRASIQGLQARFKNWETFFGVEFDLTIPPEIDAMIINPVANTSVGRIFLKDVFVDYAIPLDGLDTSMIARVRNGTIAHINANGLADDVASIVIEGVEVSLTKRSTTVTARPILQTAKAARFLNTINIVALLSIGTVQVAGWNGAGMHVPYHLDTALERQEIRGIIEYDSLWTEAMGFKEQLALYTIAKKAAPDDWATTLVEAPEIGFYITNILGIHPHELSTLLIDEYRWSSGDVNAYMTEQIRKSDMPLGMKLKFMPVPGLGQYETAIPLWVSAVEENGVQYMVLWAEAYENHFNLNFGDTTGIMPMMILEKPVGGTWTVTYQDTDRMTVGFVMAVTPVKNAICTLTSAESLQSYCWFTQ